MDNQNILNWVLKEEKENFKIINKNLKSYLNKFNFPNQAFNSYLKWDEMDLVYSFNYDEYEDQTITKYLNKTILTDYENIYIDLDNNKTFFYQLKTSVLINRWNDLLSSTGFMGLLAFTDDGQFVIEFLGDHKPYLVSNFKVLPNYPTDASLQND